MFAVNSAKQGGIPGRGGGNGVTLSDLVAEPIGDGGAVAEIPVSKGGADNPAQFIHLKELRLG